MFKTLAFIIISAGIIIAGLWAITRVPIEAINQKEPMPMEITYDQRVREENAGIPATLHIPGLYLYSTIEENQIDQTGYLFPPKDESNVVWYKDSMKLGEKGITILVGNFDLQNGRGGPYYHLGALEDGDSIEVLDRNGKKFSYSVIDKGIYDWDSTKIKSLITKSTKPRLYLIMYPAQTAENKNQEISKKIIYTEMK